MTPGDLIQAANYVERRWPGAVLAKNGVGNLVVVTEDDVVAYVDLADGGVHEFTW